MTRKELLKTSVVNRLYIEGVSAKNYTTLKAIIALKDCVRASALMSCLRRNESEIVERLSQITQINATEQEEIMQQFTAKISDRLDIPDEFNKIVQLELFNLI
jgi:hypothetical protein